MSSGVKPPPAERSRYLATSRPTSPMTTATAKTREIKVKPPPAKTRMITRVNVIIGSSKTASASKV